MKKLLEKLFAAAAISMVIFAAGCTPQEDTQTPVFPATKGEGTFDLTSPDGNTMTLSISPNMTWSVTLSDDVNFQIADENGNMSSTTGGQAGDYTIYIVCTREYPDEESHSVDVLMTMGGQTQSIATYHLASAVPEYSFRKAVTDENGFVAATDGVYQYQYEDLEDDTAIPMIWSAADNAYVSYILLNVNFDHSIELSNSSAMTMSPVTENAWVTEYKLTYNIMNGEDVSMTLTSSIENYESMSYKFTAPEVTPSFSLRTAKVDGNGEFIYTDAENGYNCEYDETPLDSNGEITFVSDPVNSSILAWILVKSNYTFTAENIEKPEWLTISEPSFVDNDASTFGEQENYYSLTISYEDYNPDVTNGQIVFRMDETNAYTYTVVNPDIEDFFYVLRPADMEFDAAGEYQQSEMMQGNPTVEVTSAENLHIYIYETTTDGGYSQNPGWITASYDWTVGGDAIQTKNVTVKVEMNERDEARTAIVVAVPESLADGVESIVQEGSLIPEYAQYLVANVTQNGQPGAVEQVEPSYWEMEGAFFETLESDPLLSMMGIEVDDMYQVTYTVEDMSQGFGLSCEFDINFDYDDCQVYEEVKEDFGSFLDVVSDPDNYWAKLKAGSAAGRYYIEATTASTAANFAYFIFMKEETPVAVIKFNYDVNYTGGGDADIIELEMMQGYGCTFTLLTGTGAPIPDNAEGTVYLLEYMGDSLGAIVAISGMPDSVVWVTNDSSDGWVTCEQPYAGMWQIGLNPAESSDYNPEETTQQLPDVCLKFMESSGNYPCTIVVRATITNE